MEFIIADANGIDTCIVPDTASIDMELGGESKNDFTLTIPYNEYDQEKQMAKGYVYCNGTEYGGILEDPEENTSSETITFGGDTFRGMLKMKIVQPPKNSAYRVLNGSLESCMRSLIGNRFGQFFVVTGDSGITIENWKVDRFSYLLQALEKLLKSVGKRIDIAANGLGDSLFVEISAKDIDDRSEDVEISQDGNVHFKIKKVTRRYEYMTCAGSGELENRMVVYLHCDQNGNVTEVDSIPDGINVREYFHDYPSAESLEELIKSGTEKFTEINKKDEQSVTTTSEDELAIGDIVGGRSYKTGFYLSEAITEKIIKYSRNRLTISYKVGG